MSDPLFPNQPDEARVWIYPAGRPLTPEEQRTVRAALDDFCAQWTAHGRRVQGGVEIIADRFVVIAGLIPAQEISGCGIDASTKALRETAERLGFAWASPLSVFYRDADGAVQAVPRAAFRERARAGDVTTETPVFDVSVTTVGALRTGRFELPAGDAWHGRTFNLATPAA